MTARRVVVDASVARSAGRGDGAQHPPAPACIAALAAIDAGGLHVVMSAKLKDEWQRHARPYARTWLFQMMGRKRFAPHTGAWAREHALLDAAADLPGNTPNEVGKDAHLVSLAFATDRRVVSCDARQRALLGRLCAAVPELISLHWADPSDSPTEPWLRSGAPEFAALCIPPP